LTGIVGNVMPFKEVLSEVRKLILEYVWQKKKQRGK